MENFSSQRGKKKSKFFQKKDCVIQSLQEVNSFLCNIKKAKIAFSIYRWFK